MIFGPNDSPLAGREGTQLTGSKIGERLNAEAETSVSLRVLPVDGGGESFEVQARGELQLGLLIGKYANAHTAAKVLVKECFMPAGGTVVHRCNSGKPQESCRTVVRHTF